MAAAKVLIVDDDEDALALINLLLRAHDYETFHAADAYHALAVARKEQPDAIVLDYGLPGGDAISVIERLRRIATMSLTPILVVSARDREGNAERAIFAGATCFIQKPFHPDELLQKLRQALVGSGPISAEREASIFRLPLG
jgi:DNA-binding response OmpR family regulator